MRIFGLLLLLVITVTTGLVYYNWEIIVTPHELSLGFTTANIPLGLVMLGILIFTTTLFLINLVYLQSAALFQARRHSHEIENNKKLIDNAESSRIQQLQNYLEAEMAKQVELNSELKDEVFFRADQLENNMQTMLENLDNTLDAYIGELEDRIENKKYLTIDNE